MKANFSLADDSLTDAMDFVEAFCKSEAMPDKNICFRIRLVYEELITNIFKHAVNLKTTFFDVTISHEDNLVAVNITYDGESFNPTLFKDERLDEPFSQNKKEGGLGLFLVSSMSKSFAYKRKDKLNIINVEI